VSLVPNQQAGALADSRKPTADSQLHRGSESVVPDWANRQIAVEILGEEPDPDVCCECGRALRDAGALERLSIFEDGGDEGWFAEHLGDGGLIVTHDAQSLRLCGRCAGELGVWLSRFSRAARIRPPAATPRVIGHVDLGCRRSAVGGQQDPGTLETADSLAGPHLRALLNELGDDLEAALDYARRSRGNKRTGVAGQAIDHLERMERTLGELEKIAARGAGSQEIVPGSGRASACAGLVVPQPPPPGSPRAEPTADARPVPPCCDGTCGEECE
jgi:hypothetical protein